MERLSISVTGVVQGVGYRPFVYGLATRLGVGGFVRNGSSVLAIEIEGLPSILESFLSELRTSSPPLARVAEIRSTPLQPCGDLDFRILPSTWDSIGETMIGSDASICDDCLGELFDRRIAAIGTRS